MLTAEEDSAPQQTRLAGAQHLVNESPRFFSSPFFDDDDGESSADHAHVRTRSVEEMMIGTGHVQAKQSPAKVIHPMPDEKRRRPSFFGNLEDAGGEEAVGTEAAKNKPLPRIVTAGLPAGAGRAHLKSAAPTYSSERNTVVDRIPRNASQEFHQPRPNRQSFFGLDPQPKGKGRAMSGPPEQPMFELYNEESSNYSGMPPARPSSFYGLNGHLRASSSGDLQKLSRTPSPASSNRATNQVHDGYNRSNAPRAMSPIPPNKESSISLSEKGERSSSASRRQSHLQPGDRMALLSQSKTLDLYRSNARKTNDPDVVYDFAVFMLKMAHDTNESSEESAPRESRPNQSRFSSLGRRKASATNSASSSASSILPRRSPQLDALKDDNDGQQSLSGESDLSDTKKNNYYIEASQMLRKIADRGHVKSQYLLANLYVDGVLNNKGKQDYERAFPLWILAAKHGHVDSAFKAGESCEHGWGCRREPAKAVGWFRKASAAMHPGAMLRLGMAEIRGELGLPRKPREGFKWIKRAAELADADDTPSEYAIQALHELGVLHERGIEHVVFVDMDYASECFAKASELGHAPSAYRLGEYYEYGRPGVPQDSALSIHYYNIAAQQDHPESCFALTAWYLVGSPGVLPQSDTEAYLWAKKAAEQDLAKAEYALGYFSEMGIGTHKDLREAMYWFERAATHGDSRAEARLRASVPGSPQAQYFTEVTSNDPRSKKHRFAREQARRQIKDNTNEPTKSGKDGDCVIS